MVPGLVSLVGMLLLVGVLTALSAAWLMAHALLHPPRMSDGKALYVLRRMTPGDLGMPFEETRFAVRDVVTGEPLSLAAWWIPAAGASDSTAVLIHGYADAKVGAIAWAPMFRALGMNVLAIDLRAHGESDGTVCTGGIREHDDVRQVIDRMRAERPAATARVVLFGVSYGASIAAAVAAEADDIAAIVLDSPYVDYRTAASTQMGLMGLPGGWIRRLALWWAEVRAGGKFDAVAPVRTLAKVRCPVMAVLPEQDDFLAGDNGQALVGVLQSRVNRERDLVWAVANAGHNTAMLIAANEYRERLATFVRQALDEATDVPVAQATPISRV